jgi:hypothetical protein
VQPIDAWAQAQRGRPRPARADELLGVLSDLMTRSLLAVLEA